MPLQKLISILFALFTVVGVIFFSKFALKKLGHKYYVSNITIGPVARPDQDLAWLDTNPQWLLDRFTVGDESELYGVIRMPITHAPDTPWVIYFHGNGAVKYEDVALKAYKDLVGDKDWGFAMWSYRGYGMSTGTTTVESMCHDALLQVDRLSEMWGVVPEQLRLFGFSLGAAPASTVGDFLSKKGTPPAAAVLMSTGFRQKFPYSLIYDPSVSVSLRASIGSPLLITHGTQDSVASVLAATEDFFAMKSEFAQYYVVPAGHNHMGYPGVKNRIQAFLTNPPLLQAKK